MLKLNKCLKSNVINLDFMKIESDTEYFVKIFFYWSDYNLIFLKRFNSSYFYYQLKNIKFVFVFTKIKYKQSKKKLNEKSIQ